MSLEPFDQLLKTQEHYPGLAHMSDEQVYLMGCRTFAQFCSTVRTLLSPELYCPFCRPELSANPVIMGRGIWKVKLNDFPYKHHRHHMVIFPDLHVSNIDDLGQRAAADFMPFVQEVCRTYGLSGGFVMRYGDPRRHAGTIPHLHAHLQEPDGTGEARATLSKPPEDRARNYVRLKEHLAELEKRGSLEWLFSPEGIKATRQ